MTGTASSLGKPRAARSALRLLVGLCVCLCTLAAGCTHVTLSDDVDLTLDFNPLTGSSGALNSPYVEGSAMRIYVNSSNDRERFTGWSVKSSAPDVFSVETLEINGDSKPVSAYVRGHARSPGSAELQVFDDGGHQVGSDLVEVARPDEIRLLAHGQLLVGYAESDARVSDLRVLVGGTATYLARYYQKGRQLSGNGALSVPTEVPPIAQPVGGTAAVAQSFLFENRDWLQLSPQNSGSATIDLLVNGTPFGSFPVVAVAPGEVTSVHILTSDESGKKSGDWLVGLAQSLDAAGRDVYGVTYAWTIDGATQDSLGDLYRYQYDPRQPKMLTASFGTMAAQAFIHAQKGYVDSTNHVGCSAVLGAAQRDGAGNDRPLLSIVALLSSLAALGAIGRRQRRLA